MNANETIDAFDRACEEDTKARLDHAEAQRYGEVPVVMPDAPRNPWDLPSGSGTAIAEWRDSFICLR